MPRPIDRELGSVSSASSPSCSHAEADYIVSSPALCFGRELPECPPGGTAFIDGCGCGCRAAPEYPRQCRAQCERGVDCPDLRFEDFPDYDATWQFWAGSASSVVAGECANDGRRFIYSSTTATVEARVFSADGQFLGLGTATDVISPGCWGETYWPEPAHCESPTVTEVLSGTTPIGFVLHIPWSEGPPPDSLPAESLTEDERAAECQRISNDAREIVGAAAASVPQCSVDADCRAFDNSVDLAPCWDSCGTPQWGSTAREAAVRQALASDGVTSACSLFYEKGCQIIPSGCPLGIAGELCRENSCVTRDD